MGCSSSSSRLYLAAEDGDLEKVQQLLQRGVDAGKIHESGEAAIHRAANRGHLKIVKLLLERHPEQLTLFDTNGWAAIHLASFRGYTEIVQLLLERDPQQTTFLSRDGYTAIHFAYENYHLDIVKLLISRDHKHTTSFNQDGWAVIHIASSKGHLEIVKMLLEQNPEQTSLFNQQGYAAIHIASSEDRLEVVQLLLDRDPEQSTLFSKDGWTAIHLACWNNCIEIMRLLLDKEPEQSTLLSKDGKAAIHLACVGTRYDVVKLLLENDSKQTSLLDKDGWAAIHLACLNDRLETLKLLIEVDSGQVTLRNKDGCAAIHIAYQYSHFDILKFLLERHPEHATLLNKEGWAVIHIACLRGHLEILKLLLEQNMCQTTLLNQDGCAAIHVAVMKGHLEIMKLLLKQNPAQIILLNKHGSAAVHLACEHGRFTIVKLLLENSIEQKTLFNKVGCAAIHVASAHGCFEIVKLLLERNPAQATLLNNDGLAPVHIASTKGHLEIVELFFCRNQETRTLVTNPHGQTCLHLAASNGAYSLCLFLVQRAPELLLMKTVAGKTARDEALNPQIHDFLLEAEARHFDRYEFQDGYRIERLLEEVLFEAELLDFPQALAGTCQTIWQKLKGDGKKTLNVLIDDFLSSASSEETATFSKAAMELTPDDMVRVPERGARVQLKWQHALGDAVSTRIKYRPSNVSELESKNLGIKLDWLFLEFIDQISNKLGPRFDRDLVLNMNYFQLARLVAFGPLAFGKDFVCPRDKRPDCSIADALHKDGFSNRATYFLSWCWSYSLKNTLAAANSFKRSQGQDFNCKTCFLWWCHFCNNQFRILGDRQMQSCEDLAATVYMQLKHAGSVVVMIDQLKGSEYSNRAWCIFEIYVAAKEQIPIRVIMPDSVEHDFIEHINADDPLAQIHEAVTINAETAKATLKTDEHGIKSLLQRYSSFEAISSEVERTLVNGISELFLAKLLPLMPHQPAELLA